MNSYENLTREQLLDRLIAAEKRLETRPDEELSNMLDAQKRITNALLLMMQHEAGIYDNRVLQIILERYCADRVYICSFDWKGGFFSNISEAVAPGISSEMEYLQRVPNSTIADPITCFSRGKPFLIDPKQREKQGKSVILFPLMISGELWGYLGIDCVRQEKVWNEKEIEWLESFTDVLSVGIGQRLSMDALNKQKELLNLILDSGNLEYWTIDVKRGMLQCSEGYLRILGGDLLEKELEMSYFLSRVHPDDLSYITRFVDKIILGQLEEQSLEFRLRKQDGGWHWILSKVIKVETDSHQKVAFVTGMNINIDQTKQAAQDVLEKEAQLLQSEHKYAELFQSMNMGYAHCKVVCDADGHISDMIHVDVNPIYERFMRMPKEEFIGKQAKAECGHQLAPGLLQLFEEVANGDSRHYEYYSEQFVGWYSMSAYSHKQGEFVLLLNDITVRHDAYETIQWNEQKLRTIYDNITVGISLYDVQGEYLECNAGMLRMFGYTSELEEKPVNLLETMCNKFPEWDKRSILSLELPYNLKEHRVMATYDLNQAEMVYLLMKIIPLLNEEGQRSGYLAITIDETESRRMQQSLIKARETQDLSNAMLSSVLDISHVLPWDCDVATQTFSCDFNRYHHESQPEPIDGKYYCSVEKYVNSIHPEFRPRMREVFTNLVSGKEISFHEVYQVHWFNDREYEWIDKQGLVCEWDEKGLPKTIIGSTVVITEQKQMERNLLNALEQAEQSNRLKSAFLANMSHEIRTPLNAIVGFSEIITNTEDPKERREYAKIIANNNQLLLQLISDILDISKIEAGTLEFIYSSVNVNLMLKDVERAFRMKVDSEVVDISFVEFLPDCVIYSERNRLLQVINNLMTNAVKFTNRGSITFGYRMQGDNSLLFYVRDTGCGISKEHLPSVFGRFVKLNSFVQGTGLGLSICETIVKNLGGKIGVESELGKGSNFWFTIPYTQVEGEDLSVTTRVVRSREGGRVIKPRILIAEDNESNYKLFESMLKGNYVLNHAWNGLDAVDMYNKTHPDLILMDMKMPELGGLDATIVIREVSKDIPIIAVTAFAFDTDREKALEAGCNDFLVKPVNSKDLVEIIEKHLG